jgi:hypothetical protein
MITIKDVDYELAGVSFETPAGPVAIQLITSADGVPVLFIDTLDIESDLLKLKVWLNDNTVWE